MSRNTIILLDHVLKTLALCSTMACYHGAPSRDIAAEEHITGIITLTSTVTESTNAPTEDVSSADPGVGAPTTTTEETSYPSTSTGPGTTTMATSDGGSSHRFDMGQPDSPQDGIGCNKVDFLFVIDNSGSMQQQQAKMLNSFNGFINAIQSAFLGYSYHVGVVTSDNYEFNTPGCQTLGDLVSQTAGQNAWGGTCTPFADGHRFATEKDDLNAKFPCMAKVGTSGSPIEQPVTALIAALNPSKAQPGGCNEGFLRPDAILVVVIITDDPPLDDFDDAHPGTDTSGWHAAVLAAKNNDPEAIVMIGFVPWGALDCNNWQTSPNLINFVQSFGDQAVLASICEDDFAPIFASSVATIVETCESFPTPG